MENAVDGNEFSVFMKYQKVELYHIFSVTNISTIERMITTLKEKCNKK